jgi:hypothetical protein
MFILSFLTQTSALSFQNKRQVNHLLVIAILLLLGRDIRDYVFICHVT